MLSQYRDWKWGHSGRGNQKDEEKILTEEGGIQRTRGLSTHLAGSKFLIKWIVHKNGQWDLGTGYCGSPRECAAKSDMSTFFEKIIFCVLGGPNIHICHPSTKISKDQERRKIPIQAGKSMIREPNSLIGRQSLRRKDRWRETKHPAPSELWEEKRY